MRIDASSEKEIKEVIDHAMDKYGRLDVFFANAGVAGPHPMATETEEAFLEMMRINTWR
jgi:NAD(P)-dependent dehydrogenase (short-subunit alcohol dehydrogenase family)